MDKHWIEAPQCRALRQAAGRVNLARQVCWRIEALPLPPGVQSTRLKRANARLLKRQATLRGACGELGIGFFLQFLCA